MLASPSQCMCARKREYVGWGGGWLGEGEEREGTAPQVDRKSGGGEFPSPAGRHAVPLGI